MYVFTVAKGLFARQRSSAKQGFFLGDSASHLHENEGVKTELFKNGVQCGDLPWPGTGNNVTASCSGHIGLARSAFLQIFFW